MPMIARAYIPGYPLSNFVALFWYQEGYRPDHQRERVLPDGSGEFIINLSGDHLPIFDAHQPDQWIKGSNCLVYGPRSEFFVIDTAQNRAIMGIHFKPGGVFPFFKLPADELQNQIIPLEILWRSKANELHERLLAATDLNQRFRILEQVLTEQIVQPLTQHNAVKYVLSEFMKGQPSVVQLSDQMGISQRRLSEVFRKEVGLTPKLFSRLFRFHSLIVALKQKTAVHWADLSVHHGYYDQAHFIHDFQAFSGLTPQLYFEQRSERPQHVPMER
jgi:AraC-like DNA-binding protein